ncbi:hypothetical protein CMI37_08960 [Candidatus Pacearchaeota archaeon]|nr:hypothetical protein [Candidatus Pacearchaeota archaeon]
MSKVAKAPNKHFPADVPTMKIGITGTTWDEVPIRTPGDTWHDTLAISDDTLGRSVGAHVDDLIESMVRDEDAVLNKLELCFDGVEEDIRRMYKRN